jgi:predicted transcriptional regulator
MSNKEIFNDPEIQAGMQVIGDYLRRRREELKLTQTELAAKAEIDFKIIIRTEHGRGCGLGTLLKMLRALDVCVLPEVIGLKGKSLAKMIKGWE